LLLPLSLNLVRFKPGENENENDVLKSVHVYRDMDHSDLCACVATWRIRMNEKRIKEVMRNGAGRILVMKSVFTDECIEMKRETLCDIGERNKY
jgi:hypothetical protein